jgi:hypothetical protein
LTAYIACQQTLNHLPENIMITLNRRKFITLAGGVSLALTVPSFAFAEGGSLADIRKRGKLTVGTEAAYEPFEFVENGKVVGYANLALRSTRSTCRSRDCCLA